MNTASQPVRAAFQGERGAFSEDAARQLLGDEVETLAYRSFDDMFDAVSSGAADCAVAPAIAASSPRLFSTTILTLPAVS